ncbi:selenocysteine-specific translation elongation factor SelB [Chthonomonas calidirosea]|uniref:selenocysteine-specific translation elongation factor n=1 Tax=Chthonomonas calidirosea TaxID=454171 RepID=UPI0006DD5205|nr:selenocysteine-specific translation elongation factor [Chthonomonas calidirosea]CEK14001.1 selenocysteine-specific translation elongation factor SelB [Chthonomonas calidirosea]CEK14002.1 selenocysteine-specific translation elongation factor SelB [Chthonomonas calidirosea]
MKHVIIGTAGHVDHGKTTLIQALTGVNPDRLKEEQARGMTIDIGFAPLTLPDGTTVSIVDVPGHERFLKNMLAGATGVDVVLLVVAADESVMPQTVEHLNILRFLDVRQGVVAVTKSDLVDEAWMQAVQEDIREHLKDTFLAQAPIIPVSAITGKGLEKLRHALLSAVSRARARNTALPYRLPIDRVFTVQGFGTVVTGTLVSGTIQVGDPVEILPQKLISRVRGLQIHGVKVDRAEAGSRVAVNLAGISPEQLERGAQISAPGVLVPTVRMDAVLQILGEAPKPVRTHDRVRLYVGTDEVIGRLVVLNDSKQIPPGDQGYIQFRAEKPFVCARGDRFVIRSYSPMQLLGGGMVLDPNAPLHRKVTPQLLQALQAREKGRVEDMLESVLLAAPHGLSRRELATKLSVEEDKLEALLQQAQEKVIHLQESYVIHTTCLQALTERLQHLLQTYHQRYPLRAGMPKEELKTALGLPPDGKALNHLLAYWTSREIVKSAAGIVRLSNFVVQLNPHQERLLQRIEKFYTECDLIIPSIEEVSRAVKAPPDAIATLLRIGLEQGRFVRVAEGLYYTQNTLNRLKATVRNYIQQHGSITVAKLRDITQTNRKACLIALEYLDACGFTRRINDTERILVNASAEE